MNLVRFDKSTTFMKKYEYSEGVTYELNDRLTTKFVGQMGIATVVESADEVLPNPAAEMYEGEELANAPTPEAAPAPEPEAAPEPEPEVEEEVEEEVAGAVAVLKHLGGPWFDVIDESLGTKFNDKPLKKADAEALLSELSETPKSTTD